MAAIKSKKTSFLSTGCSLLNLALSGSAFGGFKRGKYYHIVGDSASAKTMLSMTCFAEALKDPVFSEYRRIFDDAEDGMDMDCSKLYGSKASDLFEPPAWDGEVPIHSSTVEEFYYHLDDALKVGKPFIYILDSMDALTCDSDDKKFEESRKAHLKGAQVSGSYGTFKARKNSEGLRRVKQSLHAANSILIIISQTRENPNAGLFQSGKTLSGGRALKFYSYCQIWTSVGETLKKTVKKKNRKIGSRIKIDLGKNRCTGKLHQVWCRIYPSYGIDDIGSNIDYLIKEDWWRKTKLKINAKEFGVVATESALIKMIEEDANLTKKLKNVVDNCWSTIEAACNLDRKSKY